MKGSSLVLVMLTAAVAVAVAAPAQGDGPPPPPPEAYAACSSKASGDACTVQIHDHEIHGTCAPDREGKGLLCLPDGAPPAPPAPSAGL